MVLACTANIMQQLLSSLPTHTFLFKRDVDSPLSQSSRLPASFASKQVWLLCYQRKVDLVAMEI